MGGIGVINWHSDTAHDQMPLFEEWEAAYHAAVAPSGRGIECLGNKPGQTARLVLDTRTAAAVVASHPADTDDTAKFCFLTEGRSGSPIC